MRCHYDVLQLPRDADDVQIKSSYRKLALKWHPDKNLDNADEAKKEFQLVQQAYEVLSDRQERAWYDNHREQILRGKSSDFEDNCLDVFQYCTPSCFNGYADDDSGFYTVYSNVFDSISKEEMEFFEDKDEFCSIPTFGNSTSDYDAVVKQFYDYWSSYTTKKSYAWLSPYDIADSRGKMLKLIERENKKVQQKAKQERNEEVRLLVAFVRKRDRRVKENAKKMEERVLENRAKQEKLSQQKRLERLQQLNDSKSEEVEWAKFDNLQSELSKIEESLAQQSDKEEESEDLYCVACNKVFRTHKAFGNHESSKKHRENVELLKAAMIEEDDDDDGQQVSNQSGHSPSESEEEEQVVKQRKKKKTKNVIQCELSGDEESVIAVLLSEDDFDFANPSTKKQKRKTRKTASATTSNVVETNGTQREEDWNENTDKQNPPTKKRGKKNKNSGDAIPDVDAQHCCVTCKADFSSKNKLFDHLKKTGHQVFLSQNAKSNKSSKHCSKCVK